MEDKEFKPGEAVDKEDEKEVKHDEAVDKKDEEVKPPEPPSREGNGGQTTSTLNTNKGLSKGAKAIIGLSAVAAAGAVIVGFAVPLSNEIEENDALTNDKNNLTAANDSLKGENDSLQGENESLQGENESLKGENDALTNDKNNLTTENAENVKRLGAREGYAKAQELAKIRKYETIGSDEEYWKLIGDSADNISNQSAYLEGYKEGYAIQGSEYNNGFVDGYKNYNPLEIANSDNPSGNLQLSSGNGAADTSNITPYEAGLADGSKAAALYFNSQSLKGQLESEQTFDEISEFMTSGEEGKPLANIVKAIRGLESRITKVDEVIYYDYVNDVDENGNAKADSGHINMYVKASNENGQTFVSCVSVPVNATSYTEAIDSFKSNLTTQKLDPQIFTNIKLIDKDAPETILVNGQSVSTNNIYAQVKIKGTATGKYNSTVTMLADTESGILTGKSEPSGLAKKPSDVEAVRDAIGYTPVVEEEMQ